MKNTVSHARILTYQGLLAQGGASPVCLLRSGGAPTNTSPYPDEVIDRLARAFYPAILACWNSEEGQREFAAWQAEQAHHTTSKEKQSVPDGERPVVHIVIVCGFWQGASYSGAHPVFCFALNLLAHGFQPHSSNISPGHRSESNPHSPADRCR